MSHKETAYPFLLGVFSLIVFACWIFYCLFPKLAILILQKIKAKAKEKILQYCSKPYGVKKNNSEGNDDDLPETSRNLKSESGLDSIKEVPEDEEVLFEPTY